MGFGVTEPETTSMGFRFRREVAIRMVSTVAAMFAWGDHVWMCLRAARTR